MAVQEIYRIIIILNIRKQSAYLENKHRNCVDKYLQKLNDNIENLAEVDSGLIWRGINDRRKKVFLMQGVR